MKQLLQTSRGSQRGQTGAEALLQEVVNHGIKVCFSNPGTTEMWLVSALDSMPGIRPVLCVHETVCSGAADGYFRMAQQPAMVLLHLGPGLANSLANLHNARRASSSVLAVIGVMSTWHDSADPPLCMPVHQLASAACGAVVPVSSRVALVEEVRRAMRRCLGRGGGQGEGPTGLGAANVTTSRDAGRSLPTGTPPVDGNIVAVLVPHNISWESHPCDTTAPTTLPLTRVITSAKAASPPEAGCRGLVPSQQPDAVRVGVLDGDDGQAEAAVTEVSAGVQAFALGCAQALLLCQAGKAAIICGGSALLTGTADLPAPAESPLMVLGLIAAATKAQLLCHNAFARIDRGRGLPHLKRIPYFPQEAAKMLRQFQVVVLIGAKRPVAPFGYKDSPSQLLEQSDDNIWEFDDCCDPSTAVVYLYEAVRILAPSRVGTVVPGVSCGGVFSYQATPSMPPQGRLTAAAMCQVVAALMPPGAIVVDEALTSSTAFWEASKACPPFAHLTLTGGAIGSGPALALGAALACPGRVVINLQADGSALYCTQAWWSQTRERANVVTIICNNSSYAILKLECARQRLPPAGRATWQLTDLTQPCIDWVKLAESMGVPAAKATTVEQVGWLMKQALNKNGPFLIEAVLAM